LEWNTKLRNKSFVQRLHLKTWLKVPPDDELCVRLNVTDDGRPTVTAEESWRGDT